ncbi:hypothetical protein [Brevundimonas sp.]|uniref:hypothetical protein n=1 Tax=Brevundimonas sp. TaxID=1871086 RepID=UPI003D109EB6
MVAARAGGLSMGSFEFFFSFYGLLLGLSVAVIATGVATAIQHRKKVRIGKLTLLLATFVALDIATFWDSAWTNYRDFPFSYGLLVAGLAIALTYFIAATLVFPHAIEDGDSLDDHFWANKRIVLLLLVAANALAMVMTLLGNVGKPGVQLLLINYAVNMALYLALVVPAAFAKRARLVFWTLGAHVVIYLLIAVATGVAPMLPTPAPVAAGAAP